jgi:hypothetical protein
MIRFSRPTIKYCCNSSVMVSDMFRKMVGAALSRAKLCRAREQRMTDQGFREGCGSRAVSTLPLRRKLGNSFCMRCGDDVREVHISCMVIRLHVSMRHYCGGGCRDKALLNTSSPHRYTTWDLWDHRRSRNLSSPCAIATRTYKCHFSLKYKRWHAWAFHLVQI